MFLLDTDHLVILQRRSQPEFASLAARMQRHSHADFYLSVPSLHEQMLGAHAFVNKAKSLSQVVLGYRMMETCLHDFHRFQVLPFDDAASNVYADLRKLRRVGTMDLRIASIAIANQAVVLTRNTNDFAKVPNLTVEDWTITTV